MIGPEYASIAVQAVLGPDRSGLVPAVLWLGWLDEFGDLIAMAGVQVPHEVWGATDTGVANVEPIDAGLAGDGWEIHAVGLFDAEVDGSLVVSAALPAPLLPLEDDPLAFDVDGLVFDLAEDGSGE